MLKLLPASVARIGTFCLTAALAITHAQTATESVLYSFTPSSPNGGGGKSGLIRDSKGNLYGTTSGGGKYNSGVVYKVDPSGNQTVLYRFTGGADGGIPYAGVTQDKSGNLYETTYYGGKASGTDGWGVVYMLDAAGHQQVLHTFTGGADGANPSAGVILDPSGNLYGTTYLGGIYNYGVVYEIDAAGNFTVLCTFTGPNGANPYGGLVRDSSGNLYGTTEGATAGPGTIYMLNPSGVETVLYTFQGQADGATPTGTLVRDANGNLYGTSEEDEGGCEYTCGTVFQLNPSGKFTILYSFPFGGVGENPAALVQDPDGNLYGVAESVDFNESVVFKVTLSGQETVLYTLPIDAAGYNVPGRLLYANGLLYGATTGAGANGTGEVYELTTSGSPTTLYNFPAAGVNGYDPQAGLIRDAAGNLYGTTYDGGTIGGVVFRLNPAGRETILFDFGALSTTTTGTGPRAGVVMDSSGNLYGTTEYGGGTTNAGVVYKLSPAGQETVLYTFTGYTDGSTPQGGVILDASGNVYGTTYTGGTSFAGVVFKVSPAGQETVLYAFHGPDGSGPTGNLLFDSAGNLYGTTYFGGISGIGSEQGFGTVYKLDPAGSETVLYSFTGLADGGNPTGGLARDSAGNLYGTAYAGGLYNAGVVFKVDPQGLETVLYSFTGGTDGAYPSGGVVLDSSGNSYGTAPYGGNANAGVVFGVDPQGRETVLYSFTGGADGGNPASGVIRDSSGVLFGTTPTGGAADGGAVFRITPLAQ